MVIVMKEDNENNNNRAGFETIPKLPLDLHMPPGDTSDIVGSNQL